MVPLDVRVGGQMEAVFGRIGKKWGALDFVVHSIAFSPKEALQGHVVDVSRQGFLTTMDVSCWTFIRMAHLAEPLMHKGGTLFMMTYYGSQMVVKNYNIMGVAKGRAGERGALRRNVQSYVNTFTAVLGAVLSLYFLALAIRKIESRGLAS